MSADHGDAQEGLILWTFVGDKAQGGFPLSIRCAVMPTREWWLEAFKNTWLF